MRRFRAPSSGLDKFFAAQFSAGYITNMSGFDLRQAQPTHPQDASARSVCQKPSVEADLGWNRLLSGECRLGLVPEASE
jgi:hypothetical protein